MQDDIERDWNDIKRGLKLISSNVSLCEAQMIYNSIEELQSPIKLIIRRANEIDDILIKYHQLKKIKKKKSKKKEKANEQENDIKSFEQENDLWAQSLIKYNKE